MIINADDFGAAPAVTAAILESFRHGWCSSTTLMANMPGTDEACQLAHDHRLLEHIGLHLVLDDGPPLSEGIRRCSRFCDSRGLLAFRRHGITARLDASEKSALAAEIRAQIARCRGAGVPVTHVDSHHHVHTQWAICAVVLVIAREEGIPFVRLTRNCGRAARGPRAIYKRVLNARIRRAGLARTTYFGSIEDCGQLVQLEGARALDVAEVMVHPLRDGAGQVVDGNKPGTLAEAIARLPGWEDAVSFTGRRYPR